MTNLNTEIEYYNEVNSIAKSMLEELEITDQASYEEKQGGLYDQLHQWIDGHQWIIYTAYNADVIKYSDNDEYYSDNFGIEGFEGKSYKEIGTLVAYGALYADVQEALSELTKELE